MAGRPTVMGFIGDRALRATLLELGRTFGGPAVDSALRRGLAVVRAQAVANIKRNASVSPGPRSWSINLAKPGSHLYQSFRVRKATGRSRSTPEFRLGFVGRGRGVAHLVEFGTAPHYQPRRRWRHPGARPFPFIRPAFDTHGPKAMDDMLRQLRDQVIRQAARLRAKNAAR